VIVVGARCAGAPTAMLLARKGYRVLLVDRSKFPSDYLSTLAIWPPGILRLKRWGLLPDLITSGCPVITQVLSDFGDTPVIAKPFPYEGISDVFAPRRIVLDKILINAAVNSGAEFRENFSVVDLIREGDRVVGIHGKEKNGNPVDIRGGIVIGADGKNSLVARIMQAPTYRDRPAFLSCFYSFWAGVPAKGIEVYLRPQCNVLVTPTNDDLTLVGVMFPDSEFNTFKADVENRFKEKLSKIPAFFERVSNGKRTESFSGATDLRNFYRKPFGKGWALVGDAGYHKDPNTGQGISDAFSSAELLTEAIDQIFSGRQTFEIAFARYEAIRNEGSSEMYDFTCRGAQLEPPSEKQLALRTALRSKPAEAERYIGVLTGTVKPSEFYSEESLKRILSP